MNNQKPSPSVHSVAILVGIALVLIGGGWLSYLALRSPEVASQAAVRSAPAAELLPPAPVSEPTAPPAATEPTTGSVAESAADSAADPGSEPTVVPEPFAEATVAPQSDEAPEASEPTGVPRSDEAAVETGQLSMAELSVVDEGDLDTGSSEFSAVTLNESLNRLMIADDEGRLFEFDLATDGTPIVPPRRVIRVATGAGDIEGIAWMVATTYAIAHENDGRLTIVEIDDQTTALTDEDVTRTIDTRVREVDGNGLEGVAYLGWTDTGIEFAVVDERPATLHLLAADGTVIQTLPLALPDASDVWADADSFLVLSDEGRVVVDLRLASDGTVEITDRLDLSLPQGRFEQPEGYTRDRAGTRHYVVGELPGSGRYSFGLWADGGGSQPEG